MFQLEAETKKAIRKVLDDFGEDIYYEMVVPYGYGRRGLDFNVCAWGRALYIEAKADGKDPTAQQRQALVKAWRAGAACFIISSEAGVQSLFWWLCRLQPVVIKK